IHAILVYDDYIKLNPQSPYAADIRKYTDEALDMIWWKHIDDLINRREEIRNQIKETNKDLAQSQDADFKKGLQAEKTTLEEKLAEVQGQLKELNYLSEE